MPKAWTSYFNIALTVLKTVPPAGHTNPTQILKPAGIFDRLVNKGDSVKLIPWTLITSPEHLIKRPHVCPGSNHTSRTYMRYLTKHITLIKFISQRNKHATADSKLVNTTEHLSISSCKHCPVGYDGGPNLHHVLFGTWVLWGQRGQVQRSIYWSN